MFRNHLVKAIPRLLLALWLAIGPAWAGQMTRLGAGKSSGGAVTPVALDAQGTSLQFSSGTSASYTGITVGSGSNRALTCEVNADTSSDIAPVLTWDNGGSNQSMTQIGKLLTPLFSGYLYGLVAPTAGLKTLSVTWTGSNSGYINCISWTGANPAGGATTFPGFQSTTNSGTSLALTPSGGGSSDATMTAIATGGSTHRTGSTALSWWADTSGPGGNSYGDYQLNGTATVTDTMDNAVAQTSGMLMVVVHH